MPLSDSLKLSSLVKITFFILPCLHLLNAKTLQLAWPTPNAAFAKGLNLDTFLQKTGPDKDVRSGAFGCVRNSGRKFHEGLDLFPLKSDRSGKAMDTVFAAMPGVIAHISKNSKASAYGKYIVIEHIEYTPRIYTLYAHLDTVNSGLKVADSVTVAQPLGKMGNTASFTIPLNRSHLHFEIGVRISNSFDKWYNRQLFPTPNKHGNFNGYNLIGLDPIKFYSAYKKNPSLSISEYLQSLPEVVKVMVATKKIPYLVKENPLFWAPHKSTSTSNSWACTFGPFGIPLRFEQMTHQAEEKVTVLSYDEKLDANYCRKLVLSKGKKLIPSKQLKMYLELLFIE